jgi:hypothetical protein
VSAFVDQQKIVLPTVVEAVARDFDLGDDQAPVATPAQNAGGEKLDIAEALRSLATLADRLRQSEDKDLPNERKL